MGADGRCRFRTSSLLKLQCPNHLRLVQGNQNRQPAGTQQERPRDPTSIVRALVFGKPFRAMHTDSALLRTIK